MYICPQCKNEWLGNYCPECARTIVREEMVSPPPLPKAAEPKPVSSARSGLLRSSGKARPNFAMSLAVAWFVLLIVALSGEWRWCGSRLQQLSVKLAAEQEQALADRRAAVAARVDAVQREQAAVALAYQAELTNSAWLTGAVARAQRAAEWNRRLAHDPTLARTILESNLLKMEKLGLDGTVESRAALEQVAALSAPNGSRIEVTSTDKGFQVRVAFMMSQLSYGEAGAVTKYNSAFEMRDEIKELCAHVMQDLYRYCSSREIAGISVTCDHTLRRTIMPASATEEERALLLQHAPPEMARLYRVSLDHAQAGTVLDWRTARLAEVERLLAVEYDGLKTLTITHGLENLNAASDATGQLEF